MWRTRARRRRGRCAWGSIAAISTIACALAGTIQCTASSTPECGDAAEAGNDRSSQDGGVVVINVTSVAAGCPTITEIVATPYVVDVGSSARVKAQVRSDAGTSTLQWSAASGSFGEPAATETTFVCAVAGAVQLTFTVTLGACHVSASVPIDCR